MKKPLFSPTREIFKVVPNLIAVFFCTWACWSAAQKDGTFMFLVCAIFLVLNSIVIGIRFSEAVAKMKQEADEFYETIGAKK